MRIPVACIVAAIPALAGFAPAQDLFISSRTDQIFTRARDLDGNGSANDIGEYTKVGYAPTLLREGREVKATATFGAPGFVWLDQNTRDATKLVDTNGNGVFEPAEITSVFDFSTTTGITAANTFLIGLAEASNGVFYIANNAFKTLPTPPPGTNGLWRVVGMNGAVPLAVTPAIQQSDVVTVFETNAGPASVVINAGAFERLAIHDATQTIYGYNTLDDAIYALKDLDADGKFTSAGEVVNFLNATNHKPGLGLSGDFFGGALALQGAVLNSSSPSVSNGNFLVLNAVEVDQTSGAVYVATTTINFAVSPRSCVFRCVDANANGTCNDAGEVTLLTDDAVPGTFESAPGSGIFYTPTGAAPGFVGLGVDSATGSVFVLANSGPQDVSGTFSADTVWKLVDGNFDGDAADAGEQQLVLIQKPAGSFSLELEVTPAGFFAAPFAAASNFETPGSQSPVLTPCGGSAAVLPGIRFYKGPPYLGSPDFQVSVTGTQIGSTFGQLWISFADFNPVDLKFIFDFLNGPPTFMGLPYPADLNSRKLDEWFSFFPLWGTNSPSYVDIIDLFSTSVTFSVSPVGPAVGDPINLGCGSPVQDALGRFDFTLPIPNVPAFAGANVRLQWHTLDSVTGQRVVSDLGVATLQ